VRSGVSGARPRCRNDVDLAREAALAVVSDEGASGVNHGCISFNVHQSPQVAKRRAHIGDAVCLQNVFFHPLPKLVLRMPGTARPGS